LLALADAQQPQDQNPAQRTGQKVEKRQAENLDPAACRLYQTPSLDMCMRNTSRRIHHSTA